MTEEDRGFSLRRWSARKLDAARALQETQAPPPVADVPVPVAAAPVGEAPAPQAAAEPSLPPVETLTFGSDFSAFMKPKVAEAVKRQALKKLFADPHFNVMDGLDVYIDDYSIPSPLEPELVSELWHARSTLNPPRTRINAAGYAEDVPPDEDDEAAGSADAAEGTPPRAADGTADAAEGTPHAAEGTADAAAPGGAADGMESTTTGGAGAGPGDAGTHAGATNAPRTDIASAGGESASGPIALVATGVAVPAFPSDPVAGNP